MKTIRSLSLVLTAAAVMLLAGCATSVAPSGGADPPSAASSAQRTVFQAKVRFDQALTLAVTYKKLPACSATVKLVCADAVILAQLAKAGNVADAALDAAEQAVRTPGFGANVQTTAAVAAQSAISAFVAVTANLGVK